MKRYQFFVSGFAQPLDDGDDHEDDHDEVLLQNHQYLDGDDHHHDDHDGNLPQISVHSMPAHLDDPHNHHDHNNDSDGEDDDGDGDAGDHHYGTLSNMSISAFLHTDANHNNNDDNDDNLNLKGGCSTTASWKLHS